VQIARLITRQFQIHLGHAIQLAAAYEHDGVITPSIVLALVEIEYAPLKTASR
jgi:hypothetical protein